jgi:protein O-mannosyl-transferase
MLGRAMAKRLSSSETITVPRARRDGVIAVVALLLAVLTAYANSFSVPFLFDDWFTILHNPKLRQLWPIWDAFSPPEFSGVGGRPVANLSFVLNYAISGESVRGFHAGNLVVHFAAGLALFGLVRRTLKKIERKRALTGEENARATAASYVALLVAALWTLQPLQTQSVTYVSQRTESLMGLFYFLTLYAFARATEPSAWRGWFVVSVASCFAGMATKEGMATAPVMVLLYDWVFVTGSIRAAWQQRWKIFAAFAASWVLLAMLTRGLSGRGVGFGHGMSPWDYLLIEFRAIVRYFALSIWPSPLVFDYGVDLAASAGVVLLCAVLVTAFGLVSVIALVRWPPWGFLGVWFWLTLAPTSSVVPLPLQPISENRVYVSSAAVIVALVLAVHASAGRRGVRILAGAAGAFVGLTALRTVITAAKFPSGSTPSLSSRPARGRTAISARRCSRPAASRRRRRSRSSPCNCGRITRRRTAISPRCWAS